LQAVWFTLFLQDWLVDMNLELEKKEAKQILGDADTMQIQQYLTKRQLKRIKKKMRKILGR
jgi:hypothetical protein